MPVPEIALGCNEKRPELLRPSRKRDPVETVWTYAASRPHVALILPDGRADLIVRFRTNGTGNCENVVPVLTGPSALCHEVVIAAGDGFMGLRLRPGNLGYLGDARALRDGRFVGGDAVARVPALAALRGGYRTMEALKVAMFGMASGLTNPHRTDAQRLIDVALDRLHLSGGRLSVTELAEGLHIGPRRLGRLFDVHVGLSPQLYAAVLRFQRALRLLVGGLTPAQAAHEAGYADQPHMTRAFRRHGGFTPAKMPAAELVPLPGMEG